MSKRLLFICSRNRLRSPTAEALRSRFSAHLSAKRVVCLNIPDKFAYMDPKLILLLETRVGEASFCRPIKSVPEPSLQILKSGDQARES